MLGISLQDLARLDLSLQEKTGHAKLNELNTSILVQTA